MQHLARFARALPFLILGHIDFEHQEVSIA
jgi:hypothetical protein